MTLESMSRLLRIRRFRPAWPLLFGPLLLTVSCSEGTTTPTLRIPAAATPGGTKVYVANTSSGDVSVIDAAGNPIMATIDLRHAAGMVELYGVAMR